MASHSTTLRVLTVAALLAGCGAPEPRSSSDVGAASPVPTATISVAPTPTDGRPPPRMEVEIEAEITAREGVPASMRDQYWWFGSDAGLIGTTAHIGLPVTERVLHVADGLVVAQGNPPGGGTYLVVRDFTTGSVIRQVQTAMAGIQSVVVGRRLIWTGMASNGSCIDEDTDGGVWGLDLDSAADPTAIVPPGEVVDTCLSGRSLLLSPSTGIAVAVLSTYGSTNWMDVVDVASLSRRPRVPDAWPWAITDDTYVMWDQPPTDGISFGLGGMTAYDLASRKARWKFPTGADADRFAPRRIVALGSVVIVEYLWDMHDGANLVLAAFDARTGERHTLLDQVDGASDDELQLIPVLSNGAIVAVAPGGSWADGEPITLIDVEHGVQTVGAFGIDVPCDTDGCARG